MVCLAGINADAVLITRPPAYAFAGLAFFEVGAFFELFGGGGHGEGGCGREGDEEGAEELHDCGVCFGFWLLWIERVELEAWLPRIEG